MTNGLLPESLFFGLPLPCLLLLTDAPKFTIHKTNEAYLKATNSREEDLNGEDVLVILGKIAPDYNRQTAKTLLSSLKKAMQQEEAVALHEDKWIVELKAIGTDSASPDYILLSLQENRQTLENTARALKLKEEQYNTLFKYNPEAAFTLDICGTIISANDKLHALLGYDHKRLNGRRFEVFLPSRERDRFTKNFTLACSGEIQQYKTLLTNAEGKQYRIQLTHIPFLLEGGRACVYGIAKDISEEILLEQSIIKEQEISELLMNSLPGTFFIFDTEGRFLRWNKTLEEISGYTGEEVSSMSPLDFFDEEEKSLLMYHINKAFTDGKSEVEALLHTKSGQRIPFKYTGSRIQYEGMPCIMGTGIDISRLAHAEKQALAARDHYLSLVQSLDGIVWEARIDTLEFTFVSPQSKTILGYKPEHWYGQTNFWMEHIHPEEREEVVKYCLDKMSKGRNYQIEYRMLAADGREVWLSDVVSVIKEKGKPKLLRGVMTDISRRKETEKALEESQQKLRKILSSSLDIICTLDKDGIFRDVSEAALHVWGYRPEEIIGTSYQQYIHPEDLENTTQLARKRSSAEKKHYIENRYIRKDGSTVFMSWSAYWDEQEELLYCVGRDATEKKNAEEFQQLSEQRFRSLVQDGSDLIGILDLEGNYTYVSPTSSSVLGITPDEFLGKNAFNFIHPDDKEHVLQHYSRLASEKRIHISPFRFKHQDGNWRWVETTAVNLIDNPAVGGIVANSRDVSEQVEAELQMKSLNQELLQKTQELSLSNEQLEQFAYVASHDLQEPLRMVSSFLKQLEKKYNPLLDEKGKRYIYFAVDGANRMRQTILDLLEYSSAVSPEERIEEVDVQEVLDNVRVLKSKRIEELQAEICHSKLPKIYTSRIALQQLFQNLISNGLKFHREGIRPHINIAFSEEEDFYRFAVQDNGIGIRQEDYEKIFVIFQRLHDKIEYPGTGMGLPICKKIVERLGGKIWLESEPGQGSTFFFTLQKPEKI